MVGHGMILLSCVSFFFLSLSSACVLFHSAALRLAVPGTHLTSLQLQWKYFTERLFL